MIEAVFFDLDGTLYDRDALVAAFLQEQYRAFETELAGLAKPHFLARVLEMDDHGRGNKEAGYSRLVHEWDLAPELAPRLVDHFWQNYDRFCELSADVSLTLDTLRSRGKRLGVITNGTERRQRNKLAALGLADAFDAVLISDSEGVRKPSPEIFQRALARCDVEASHAMFVGDNPDDDIEGARRAGLHPVWKRVSYWRLLRENVATIDALSEILPMCLGLM